MQARTDAELLPPAALAERGLGPAGFYGGTLNPVGFPLNPMKYVGGLLSAAEAAGVRIYADSPVDDIRAVPNGWRLSTPKASLTARRVLIATNGYGEDDLIPWIAGRRLPVLSSILVTRPLTGAEQAAQGWTSRIMGYDTRRLLHYFRLLPDGRFLFGMRGGVSARPDRIAALGREARRHFELMFPAWRAVETEFRWSGLVCLTGSLTPFAGAVPGANGLFAAFGWHGNGVTTGTLAGRLVARAMTGAPNPAPVVMQTPPRRFPLPGLRRTALRIAYATFSLRDGPVRGPS
jgi:glycine/D-amino acid oxidase-like deaminating enzyme